jgi:hypothetical protein
MLHEEIVYKNFDNAIELALAVNDAIIDHTGIARAKVLLGNIEIDSADHPTWFDTTNKDRIIMRLSQSSLTIGRHVARLIIFDGEHTNGIVWGDFMLRVEGGLEQVPV